MRRYLLSAIFFHILLAQAHSQEVKPNEPEVTERTIKIEGTIERPRVIFIVPRARLRKDGETVKKSFIEDILKPVYPEDLIKKEIQDNNNRR